MSWITINEVTHQCTVEDLKRWDEVAAKDRVTREEVAAKEISSKSRALAKKGRADRQAEKEASDAAATDQTPVSKDGE